jgi:ABC-type Fe3+/spermidine/putrescine transport system ATPase subunit
VSVGNTMLTVPATPGLAKDQATLVFIRPNDVVIAEDKSDKNVLNGVVRQATYLGEHMDYRVAVDDGLALRVQTGITQRYAPGEDVRLLLPVDPARVISEGI